MAKLDINEIDNIGDILRAIRTNTNQMLGNAAQHNLVISNLNYLIEKFNELEKNEN